MKGYRPIECLQTRIKLDAIDLRILEAEAVAGALYLDRERILEPYKKRLDIKCIACGVLTSTDDIIVLGAYPGTQCPKCEAEGLTNFEEVLP